MKHSSIDIYAKVAFVEVEEKPTNNAQKATMISILIWLIKSKQKEERGFLMMLEVCLTAYAVQCRNCAPCFKNSTKSAF